MVQDVRDLDSPPIVGRYYWVPVVRALHTERFDDWPVIGPAHTDAEIIGFPWKHLHLDLRFLRAPQVDMIERTWPIHGWTCGAYVTPVHENATYGRNVPLPTPVPRKRRCLRDQPPSPFPEIGRWFQKLQDHYADARLGEGMICPHRGFCLKSQPVRPDGTVVCPGHGLAWDVETGRLVRQKAPAP